MSQRTNSPPRRQRACEPCSKAKARCQFPGAGDTCDRCDKMGIQCAAKTTKSLRKPRQIKPLNSRVLYLEEQLDRLTSELEIRGGGSVISDTASASSATPTSASRSEPSANLNTSTTLATADEEPNICHPHATFRTRPPLVDPRSSPPFGLTWPQAERIVDIFRSNYMHNFPFVVLRPKLGAKQLYEERPFTFRSIILVAAPLPIPRIGKIKRNVLAYLGQHLLVEDERNLDLLQGLLICIAWAELGNLYDEQITNLCYLALGYAHNLGITKIPLELLQQMGMDNAPEDVLQTKKESFVAKLHSMDEKRAFLGCFCLISVNSTQFGRLNPLKTQYVDICCDSIRGAQEHPTDFVLERTVRMTQVGDKISEAFSISNDRERGKPYLFLLEGSASGFRSELDSILESIGYDQRQTLWPLSEETVFYHKILTLYYNYLLVRLYEPATQSQEVLQDGGGFPSMFRSLCLRHCLFAAKAYFDTILSVPASQYAYQSAISTEQISYIVVIATRLLLINAPDWDVDFARMTLDFPSVMGQLISKLEEAEELRRQGVEHFAREMGLAIRPEEMATTGRLMQTARKTCWIRDWFEARMKGTTSEQWFAGDVGKGWLQERDQRDAKMPEFGMSSGPRWFGGLFEDSSWNFEDLDLPQTSDASRHWSQFSERHE